MDGPLTCPICGKPKATRTYEVRELGITLRVNVDCRCEVRTWEEWNRVFPRRAGAARAQGQAKNGAE